MHTEGGTSLPILLHCCFIPSSTVGYHFSLAFLYFYSMEVPNPKVKTSWWESTWWEIWLFQMMTYPLLYKKFYFQFRESHIQVAIIFLYFSLYVDFILLNGFNINSISSSFVRKNNRKQLNRANVAQGKHIKAVSQEIRLQIPKTRSMTTESSISLPI